MLKPGGATFGVFLAEMPMDDAIFTLSKHPKWSTYEHFLSPFYRNSHILEIYQRNLEECGFINCYIEQEEFLYDFLNEVEFRG